MGYAQKIREAHETLTLPSGYHVTMRLGLSIKEQEALPELGGATSGPLALAAGKAAIVALIESWDLDAEDGTPLPITAETVEDMGGADAAALLKWVNAQGLSGWRGTPQDQRDFSMPSAGGSPDPQVPPTA